MARSESPDYFLILGEPVLRRTVYLVIGITLLIVGGGFGGVYYLLLQGNASADVVSSQSTESVVASDEVAVEANDEVVVDEIGEPGVIKSYDTPAGSLKQVLQRHVSATGHGEAASFFIDGVAEVDKVKADVTVMGRRPNLYKLKSEYHRTDIMVQLGYNGDEGWLRQEQANLDLARVELFMQMALFECSVAHLTWTYQSEEAFEFGIDAFLERMPAEKWQGRACEVIVSRGMFPFEIYHYLDADTYEEVYRRAQVYNDDQPVLLEMHIEPSQLHGVSRAPSGYQLYVDGTAHDRVDYIKVRTDRVMLSKLFEIPSDASMSGLAPRR